METVTFEFYGVGVAVTAGELLAAELKKDFSYFIAASRPDISLSVRRERPPYGRVPAVRASLYQPDSITYDAGAVRFVDYGGRALAVYDYAAERGELFAEDDELLHELSYLLIQSRVGELLDRRGIHRVHALGLSRNGAGLLCLLPQGGGKTTLCLDLLKENEVRLLSDDTPLLKGTTLLPFPVRIGVEGEGCRDIPERFLGRINRRRYGVKTLIDVEYFKEKISGPVPIRAVLVAEREFSGRPRIVPRGKLSALRALFRDCVAGLGLPQMVEYFLRRDLGDLAGKAGIVLSRAVTALRLAAASRTYTFVLGRDTKQNAAVLLEFMKRLP